MENAGKRWTREEDEKLMNLFVNEKMNYQTLSAVHKRTVNAIKMRLEYLGLSQDNMRNVLNRIEQLENEVSKLKDQIEYSKYSYYWNIKRLD